MTTDPVVKPGHFLLSRSAFRTKVILNFLTWVNLALVTGAVVLDLESQTAIRWLVLIAFFNTVALGLTHREMLRISVQQEMEILAALKARGENTARTSEFSSNRLAAR